MPIINSREMPSHDVEKNEALYGDGYAIMKPRFLSFWEGRVWPKLAALPISLIISQRRPRHNDKHLVLSCLDPNFIALIIYLYRYFEKFMLTAISGAINQNTNYFAEQAGIQLPKHLHQSTCEYLVTKGGYFDFKGRDGLLRILNQTISKTHVINLSVSS